MDCPGMELVPPPCWKALDEPHVSHGTARFNFIKAVAMDGPYIYRKFNNNKYVQKLRPRAKYTLERQSLTF
jgi:hypothetical protein